jgi:hypothetical protein
MIKLRLMAGKYYNPSEDDLLLTPAIVYATAKYNDRDAKAIGITWIHWTFGIAWIRGK